MIQSAVKEKEPSEVARTVVSDTAIKPESVFDSTPKKSSTGSEARVVKPAVARSEPSPSAGIINFVNEGEVVVNISNKRENGYVRCNHCGSECWIHADALEK